MGHSLLLWAASLLTAAPAVFGAALPTADGRVSRQADGRPGSPPQIITGLYFPAKIAIHDAQGNPSWSWGSDDYDGQQVPSRLKGCLKASGVLPDAKWANGGRSILAIVGSAAVMINHHPENPSTDKQITFGMCLDSAPFANTHSLELVTPQRLAIATTSDSSVGNVRIVDPTVGAQNPDPPLLQGLDGMTACHSLVWDDEAGLLWAVGNDQPPLGTTPSRSILNSYAFDRRSGAFDSAPAGTYVIGPPQMLSQEWPGPKETWWDGSHHATPVPNKRQLFISTDLDVHLFDMGTKTFRHGDEVLKTVPSLRAFQPGPTHRDRLPRGDIKSASFDGKGNALFTQADWGDVLTRSVHRLGRRGAAQAVALSQQLYRSRWFAPAAGWRTSA